MSKIYDNTLYYKALRLVVGFTFKRFFRQIEIRGTENIPSGEPLIFAANHQNALLDPLAILFYQSEPILFMARADMFQNKLVAKILRSFKIAPIYRIRDGFENLSKNEEQMNEAVDVLLNHRQLCLMPEGNHGHQHKLRPLVKGLFRIACSAEDALNGESHVKIIPVGIDYNYFQHAGSDLVVTYGKTIEVKDYIELYKDNTANCLNVLRDRLSAELSPLMHDIKSTNHYDLIYRMSCYGTPAYLDYLLDQGDETEATTMAGLRFDARCALSRILDRIDVENPEKLLELDLLCQQFRKLPGSPAEVTEWLDVNHFKGYSNLLIVFSILLIPGFLMNAPTWYITKKICSNVDDTQMRSTFAFVVGMLLNGLIYVVLTVVLAYFFSSSFLMFLCLLIFVTSYGLVSERARQSLRLPLRRLFFSFGKRKDLLNACKNDFQIFKKSITKLF